MRCAGPNDIKEPPTVGLNVKIMKRNGVTCKVWDIGTDVGLLELLGLLGLFAEWGDMTSVRCR